MTRISVDYQTKREDTIIKIRNKSGDITTDFTRIKK